MSFYTPLPPVPAFPICPFRSCSVCPTLLLWYLWRHASCFPPFPRFFSFPFSAGGRYEPMASCPLGTWPLLGSATLGLVRSTLSVLGLWLMTICFSSPRSCVVQQCCCLASLGPKSTEVLRPEQRDSAIHLNPCLDLVGTSLSWGFVFSWVLRLSRASPKEGPSVLMKPSAALPGEVWRAVGTHCSSSGNGCRAVEEPEALLPEWLLIK